MSILYVTEPGASVRRRGDSIIVEKDGSRLAETEMHRLKTVVLYGPVQVTTQALHALMRAKIEVALLSTGGKLLGQVTPPLPLNIGRRLGQHEKWRDPAGQALELARAVVRAKILNATALVMRARRAGAGAPLEAVEKLRRRAGEALDAPGMAALCGVEGLAAREYFALWPALIKNPGFTFAGRSRRPPRDPVNALLSFGYVLLVSRLQSFLDATAWDPYLGFFHQAAHGRPSLALDLLEPLRAPIVDRFVLRAINLRVFAAGDFTTNEREGCRLTPGALKRFFAHWEKHLNDINLEGLFDASGRDLERAMNGEIEAGEAFYLMPDRGDPAEI